MKTDEELKNELFNVWTDVQYALPIMYNHIVKRRFRTVLELGVRNAVSTRAILLALKKTNGHLWSVDIRACNRGISAVKEWRLDNIWTFIQENDLDLKWNKVVDMLFIDTLHTFEHTMLELEKFAPFVQHTIFMHDTLDGKSITDCGKAAMTYVTEHPTWKFEELGGQYGLGMLTRRLMVSK